MSRKVLIHDTAYATATALLEYVRDRPHKDEYQDAHKTFYDLVKIAIEGLDTLQGREDLRLLRKVSTN
jgi:hypothetical protein